MFREDPAEALGPAVDAKVPEAHPIGSGIDWHVGPP